MTASNTAALLSDPARAVSIPVAAGSIKPEPGLYSIFVDDPAVLPDPFRSRLTAAKTRLLYVGLASDSLRERLIEQDLRHKRPATFFRGLGAALGYRPKPGSLRDKANKSNYKFERPDTTRIIAWMEQHLTVSWLALKRADAVALEPSVIASLCPVFNTTHNRTCCPELAELRAECRRIARS
jgi:hypothetical protein